jgi:predicted Fe-Mo cluster-binding NifX family protein
MKVAIPVYDEVERRNEIAGNLSVMGFLCIFDTESQEGKWIKTLDLAPNMGELLPALHEEEVTAIITRQIHPMALKVLVGRGMEVYRSVGNMLDENLRLFNDSRLLSFDMDTAMTFAKVCGGECDDCKTDCETPTNV